MRVRFEQFGTVLVGSTPEEFASVIKKDLGKWAIVLKSAGLASQ